MSQTPEILAEAMKTAPTEEVTTQIEASSLDDLKNVARVIEEKKIVTNEKSLALVHAQFDVLYSQMSVESKLTELESLGQLMSLLQIKAPVTPLPSKLDKVAGVLNGIAITTEKLPVINFFTGFFKGMRGRDLERVWYSGLAVFEKNPGAASGVGGLVFGTFGAAVGLLGLNFGARKNLLRMSIEDAIAANTLAGDRIGFSGIQESDLTTFKEQLATADIPTLTREFLKAKRKLSPDSPITVTLAALLKPEELQSEIQAQETVSQKKAIMEKLKPADVASVEFGTNVSALRNGAGHFDITIPKPDGSSLSAEVQSLQTAMQTLSEAKKISIVSSEENLTITPRERSISIPVDTNDITPPLNRAFAASHRRLNTIIFDRINLSDTVMQARFVPGTLLLGPNEHRLESLNHLEGLVSLLGDAKDGQIFEFRGGSWSAVLGTPMPSTPTVLSSN